MRFQSIVYCKLNKSKHKVSYMTNYNSHFINISSFEFTIAVISCLVVFSFCLKFLR